MPSILATPKKVRAVGLGALALALGLAGCGLDPTDSATDVATGADPLVSMPTPKLAYAGCPSFGDYTGPGGQNGVRCAFSPYQFGAELDGIDDLVELPNQSSYQFTSRMTAAAWVKPATTTGTRAIVGKWSSPDAYRLLISNGAFQFQVAFSNGTTKTVSSPAATNAWSHVAGVYDGSKLILFVNGVQKATTAASGNIRASSRPIAIGNWPTSSPFKGVIDEVNLYNVALTSAQVAQLAGRNNATSAPKTKKVFWLVYDPILSNGQRLHERYGWNDPQSQIPDIMASIQVASGKYVDYQIRELHPANHFPPGVGGFQFTEASYDACITDPDHRNCGPNAYDYGRVFTELGLCSRIQAGDIDEVSIYGFDYTGVDEFAFKIPNDDVPYNMPTNEWLYQNRRYNLPDCGRTYFVMGYNYVVGVDNALHSFGHRTESALALTVGRGFWDGCVGHPGTGPSDFDRYTCINRDKTSSGVNVAHVGNVHFPPNALEDYQYDNPTSVSHAAKSWVNYPFTTPTLATENCTAWGCNQMGFMMWWLNHLPHKDGITSNGNLKNWWKYVVDFDGAVRELGL